MAEEKQTLLNVRINLTDTIKEMADYQHGFVQEWRYIRPAVQSGDGATEGDEEGILEGDE